MGVVVRERVRADPGAAFAGTLLFDKSTDETGVNPTNGRGVVTIGGRARLPPVDPRVPTPKRGPTFTNTRELPYLPELLLMVARAGSGWYVFASTPKPLPTGIRFGRLDRTVKARNTTVEAKKAEL